MLDNILIINILHLLSITVTSALVWIFGVWIIKLIFFIFLRRTQNMKIDIIAGLGSLLFLLLFVNIGSPYK